MLAFRLFAVGLVALTVSSVFAQDRDIVFGARAGVTLPTDADTRRIFGDQWFSFGLTPFRNEAKGGIRQSASFNITTRNSNGNRLALFRPSYGLAKTLGDDEATFVTYIAGRVGLVYADYAFNDIGGRISGKKVGWGGNVEFGMVFNRNFILSARYDMMTKFEGFNFNGLTLEATFRIGSF